MEGVMMRGEGRMATSIRLPDGRIYIKTKPLPKQGKWMKIPVLRGIFAFVTSLIMGMKTLIYSADVLEEFTPEDEREQEEPGAFTKWLEKHFGEKAAWNIAIYISVALAIILAVAIFILLPTVIVNLLTKITDSRILLNLAEGVLRILIFIGYILAVGHMKDIRTTFEYHGAEHKTIHCFENNLELTPENAKGFYTVHPRCGTSFMMFVMIISLILFSLLGWPNIWVRLISRILLIPLVAGLSYELLKWAGRSDNSVVKVLSMPGLYLQKLTTREPSSEQLEIAITSMKAVLVDDDAPYMEGICDKNAHLIEEYHVGRDGKNEKKDEKKDDKQGDEKEAAEDLTVTNIKQGTYEDIEMSKEYVNPGTDEEFDVKEYEDGYRADYENDREKEKEGFFGRLSQIFKKRSEEEPEREARNEKPEEKGFMNFFSKQREEVGSTAGGRNKNAAGIPVWDDAVEIEKAKENHR